MTVAEYIASALEKSDKSQTEIAELCGYARSNIISMFKTGVTKLPIEKVPALARALDVDAFELLQIAMHEYQPEVWEVITSTIRDRQTYPGDTEAPTAPKLSRDTPIHAAARPPSRDGEKICLRPRLRTH